MSSIPDPPAKRQKTDENDLLRSNTNNKDHSIYPSPAADDLSNCPLKVFFEIPNFFDAIRPFLDLQTISRLSQVCKDAKSVCCDEEDKLRVYQFDLPLTIAYTEKTKERPVVKKYVNSFIEKCSIKDIRIMKLVSIDPNRFGSSASSVLRKNTNQKKHYESIAAIIEEYVTKATEITELHLLLKDEGSKKSPIYIGILSKLASRNSRKLKALTLHVPNLELDGVGFAYLECVLDLARELKELNLVNLAFGPDVSTSRVQGLFWKLKERNILERLTLQSINFKLNKADFQNSTDIMNQHRRRLCESFLKSLHGLTSLKKLSFMMDFSKIWIPSFYATVPNLDQVRDNGTFASGMPAQLRDKIFSSNHYFKPEEGTLNVGRCFTSETVLNTAGQRRQTALIDSRTEMRLVLNLVRTLKNLEEFEYLTVRAVSNRQNDAHIYAEDVRENLTFGNLLCQNVEEPLDFDALDRSVQEDLDGKKDAFFGSIEKRMGFVSEHRASDFLQNVPGGTSSSSSSSLRYETNGHKNYVSLSSIMQPDLPLATALANKPIKELSLGVFCSADASDVSGFTTTDYVYKGIANLIRYTFRDDGRTTKLIDFKTKQPTKPKIHLHVSCGRPTKHNYIAEALACCPGFSECRLMHYSQKLFDMGLGGRHVIDIESDDDDDFESGQEDSF